MIEENGIDSRSDDLARYGRRLRVFLLALKSITALFTGLEGTPTDEKIDQLLKRALPSLCKAFNSQVGFLADEKGNIFFSNPPGDQIIGKKFPKTGLTEGLMKNNEPLLIDNSLDRDSTELSCLQVQSLLVVSLSILSGLRLIGVANGQNKPLPYMSAEKKFFNELMKIVSDSINIGYRIPRVEEKLKEEMELRGSLERYRLSKLRGEWGNLASASEDYAKRLTEAKNSIFKKNEDKTSITGESIDDVLTDCLDANLCNFIHTVLPKSNKNIKFERLIRLTRLIPSEKEAKSFPTNFERTSLAAARIYLFLDNPRIENSVKQGLKKLIDSSKKIWGGPVEIMGNIEEVVNNPNAQNPINLIVDWLRTKWQHIYYLAQQGIDAPDENRAAEIDKVYTSIHTQSVDILKEYLEKKSSGVDLRIDSDWLISWLAGNALLSNRLNEYYDLKPKTTNPEHKNNSKISPIAKMRYLKNLSFHILYVLYCFRFTRSKNEAEINEGFEGFKRPPFADILVNPHSSLSEAQLFIISEYAYREIGIHRELRIFERLSHQLSNELPLYAASNYYRDHLFHVMDVCLLGELLLRSIIPGRGQREEFDFLTDVFSAQDLNNLLKNWYMAALCHDLGYVIEQSEKFLNPISKISGPGLSNFSNKLKKGLSEAKCEIRETIKKIGTSESLEIPRDLADKLVKDEVSTDHGVAAWLHLRHWIEDIKFPLKSFGPALTAILRHNMSDQEFDIQKEPLTFLLMLCDHIQEWGRPRVEPDLLARGVMESLRFTNELQLDQKIRMSEILIDGLDPRSVKPKNIPQKTCENCVLEKSINCKTSCLRVIPVIDRSKGITFTLPHLEAREADFEPCISWLMFCRDLQSIKYRKNKFPFPVTIIMKHIPPRIWSAFGWGLLEMDIFEEFANTYSSATYLCQWIELAKGNKEGLMYEGDRKNGEETFTIYLHKLEHPLKRDLADEHWKDFFKWKWHWLSHKYTTSNLGPWYPDQK